MRTRHWIGIGLVLIGGGLVLGLRPFRMTISMPGAETSDGPVEADCRRPWAAAWNTEPKGPLALWAVTRGTDQRGYEARSGQGPYCARPARKRLAVSAVAMVGGAVLVAAAAKVRTRS